jgi:hypothetical protein
VWLLAAGGAALIASILIAGGGDREAAAAGDRCCFTNPRFTGVCSVTPGEGESCASILAYLNNPSSAGKAYCGGTSIRGGWQQVDCAQ